MEAHISASGELTIKSVTDLEHYALKKWWEDWNDKKAIFHIQTIEDGTGRFKNVKNDDL